jgi:tetratricopeptide (TPR) repeat protein
VRQAAGRRYEALSADARAVADAAVVLGPLATRPRLASITRLTDDATETAIEELVLRRVLRPSPGNATTLEFVHDVTHQVVLARLSGTRRRTLHAAAWRVLRSEPPTPEVTSTALAQHRRAAGPLGGRLPPWVGTRTLVVAAGVVLVALAAWLRFAPRPNGFAERDWIVLADLENTTGDPVFDESLTAALYVAISQSQYVNVYPPARVRETLQRMRRSDTLRLTEWVAREVAQREGIRAVVTLVLARAEDRYTLTARVVDPESGGSLATLSAEADGRDRVLSALDGLAVDLRERLGESARGIREGSIPLPRATTASLDALKAFAEGMRAQNEGRSSDAMTAWEAAIALDSGFASAYAELGWYIVWTNLPVDAEPYLTRAQALADRLPPRERLQVEWTVARGRGDDAAAIRLAREYLRQYPDDREAWFGLARSLQEAGDAEGALEAYQRELEIDPNASAALENSALLYSLASRPREAVAVFERAMALDSMLVTRIAGDRNRLYGFALLSLGDTARARATFTLLLSGNPAQRANGLRSLALLEAYQGRYRRAADWLTQAIQVNLEGRATVSELRNRLHLAGMLRTAGRGEDARVHLRRALTIQESSPAMPLTWLGFLTQQLARSRMLAEADRVAAAMEGHRQLRTARDSAWLALARGEIALARGDAAAAAAELAVGVLAERRNYLRQGLARALVAAARLDEGVGMYQSMLRDSSLGDEAQEPWVLAHYELAQLYDALGDSAAALPLYRRLAAQWRAGDADLPVLQAIRRRLGSGG